LKSLPGTALRSGAPPGRSDVGPPGTSSDSMVPRTCARQARPGGISAPRPCPGWPGSASTWCRGVRRRRSGGLREVPVGLAGPLARTVASRNERHFRRAPGLSFRAY